MYKSKNILIIAILLTTLPFLILLKDINWVLKDLSTYLFVKDIVNRIANIFGLIGVVLFFWQIFLGNKYLVKKISTDAVWINNIHKKIGILSFIFVFSHPFLESFAYSEFLLIPTSLVLDLNDKFERNLSIGRIALYIFILIWVLSALIKKKLKYKYWHYLHLLTYPMVFAAFIHSSEIGFFLNKYSILKFIWQIIPFLIIIIILYRLLKFMNVWSVKYELIKKNTVGDKTEYTLKPTGKFPEINAGQFVFINHKAFSNSHPFTVLASDKNTGIIQFTIKTYGDFTSSLSNLNVGDNVYINGPYGVFVQNYDSSYTNVFIAGGIGITPFIHRLLDANDTNNVLIYSNNTIETAYKRDNFKEALNTNYYEFLANVDNQLEQNQFKGFINKDNLHKILNNYSGKKRFYICGAPKFVEVAIQILKDLDIPEENIFTEQFSY